jgi:hypothetical protein
LRSATYTYMRRCQARLCEEPRVLAMSAPVPPATTHTTTHSSDRVRGVCARTVAYWQDLWAGDRNADLIIGLRLHRMTYEDVVLILITILPLLFGLAEVIKQLRTYWGSLQHEADQERLAKAMAMHSASGGRSSTFRFSSYERAEHGDVESPASWPAQTSSTRPARPSTRVSASGGGRGHASSDARVSPARLPPPSWFVSCGRCLARSFGGIVPKACWPSFLLSRAETAFRIVRLNGFWSTLCAVLSNCLCCLICSSIMRRVGGRPHKTPTAARAAAGSDGNAGRQRSGPSLEVLALRA